LFIGEIGPGEQQQAVAILGWKLPEGVRERFNGELRVHCLIKADGNVRKWRFARDPLDRSEHPRFRYAMTVDEICRDSEQPRLSIVTGQIESSPPLECNQKRLAGHIVRDRLTGSSRNITMHSGSVSVKDLTERPRVLKRPLDHAAVVAHTCIPRSQPLSSRMVCSGNPPPPVECSPGLWIKLEPAPLAWLIEFSTDRLPGEVAVEKSAHRSVRDNGRVPQGRGGHTPHRLNDPPLSVRGGFPPSCTHIRVCEEFVGLSLEFPQWEIARRGTIIFPESVDLENRHVNGGRQYLGCFDRLLLGTRTDLHHAAVPTIAPDEPRAIQSF
jgi:hypothetical protein